MRSKKMSDGSDNSDKSDSEVFGLHGGYRKLRSFQTAQVIYDATVAFCDRFLDKRTRTRDQMVQAARSGRQNIAEASMASATSKKSEIKLTNVAKASLEELLLDYEDFLRQRGLMLWNKHDRKAVAARRIYRSQCAPEFSGLPPEEMANTLVCLIHQAIYLLRGQLRKLERDFIEQGGFTERLHRARTGFRKESDGSDRSDKSDSPVCPHCGRQMVRRIARVGRWAGQPFWGCPSFPDCKGIRQL